MGRMKYDKSLLDKMLIQFIVCLIIILLLATPLFYWLTKNFYAEDMMEIIKAVKMNRPLPDLDLEEDIIQGVMIQFAFFAIVLGITIVLTTRFISKRLWKPFEKALTQLNDFRLESGSIPILPQTDIKEFQVLNQAITNLMQKNLNSYRAQKEFTENASHELQTPLAVFQSKLDVLLQQPELTREQAEIIQGLYQMTNRLSRLNRNLLLLAKIDNKQYAQMDCINVSQQLGEILPMLDSLLGNINLHQDIQNAGLVIRGNKSLFESMVNNLIVNAVRHNVPHGEITLVVKYKQLIVSNTSEGEALNSSLIFNRFYRPYERVCGNGLGLAIVKAICDYHGWTVEYAYTIGVHHFIINF